jgi:glyoxylase-like metal-dependent hydrolase (beta-lactamase superfamily II)
VKNNFLVEKVGFLEVNCYLIPSELDSCVYIIDPGASPDKIATMAKSFKFDSYKIILTHAHIDHICALNEIMQLLNTDSLYLHNDDMPLYKSPANELQPLMPALKKHPKPSHSIESKDFEIIHTPGHTRGGVCFYFKRFNTVFTGDTLFKQSIGRTDFPGGNMDSLLNSIKNKLFALPDDTVVCPGHADFSSIKDEKKLNPFL